MRLFLGFAPDDAEMRKLYDGREGLALTPDLPIAWTPEENWHITLCFLGELPSNQLQRVSSAVTSIAEDSSPLDLRLDTLEWFPSPSKARLLALCGEAGGAGEGLAGLQADVSSALRREGFNLEHREYRPHLTLARVRERRGHFSPPVLPLVNPVDFRLQELCLFESVAASHGRRSRPRKSQGSAPVYHCLERFPLAGFDRNVVPSAGGMHP